MSYICVECEEIAEETDIGNPIPRECPFGGNCRYIKMEEFQENKRKRDRDDHLEDMRLFNG